MEPNTLNLLIQALVNVPLAIVLIVWVYLDFKNRAANMAAMTQMVEKFTATLKECCDE